MFLERPDLVGAIERRLPKRRAGAFFGPSGRRPASGGTSGELVALVTCACCGGQMERGRFAASSGVVVDVCPRHGVWLDQGELAHVAAYAASPARPGDAPEVHPAFAAVEAERRRLSAVVTTMRMQEKPPRPLWMKIAPLVLFVIGIAIRWYYVQKLAHETGVDIPGQGQSVKKAGEQGSEVLTSP